MLVAKVAAQICPCSFDPSRECVVLLLDPNTNTCSEQTVPCPCYCDYSGANNNGDCLLDVALGYRFTDEPLCEAVEINIPICEGGPPPSPGGGLETATPSAEVSPTTVASPSTAPTYGPSPSTAPTYAPSPTPQIHHYPCTDDVELCGVGSIICMLPPLPCKTILQTNLVYWQKVKYDVTIGYADGLNDLKIDLQVNNEPGTPAWMAGDLPGTRILYEEMVQGPAVKVESFHANESFSVYGTQSYADVLLQNCIDNDNEYTVFPIYITYTIQNSGATFYDLPDYQGIRVATHIVVEVVSSGYA